MLLPLSLAFYSYIITRLCFNGKRYEFQVIKSMLKNEGWYESMVWVMKGTNMNEAQQRTCN